PLASSYKVYHNNMLMASNVTGTHYLAENLSNGNHCFRVSAVYQDVESPKSEEACMEINTCSPPLDFEAMYYWEDSEYGTRLIWTKDQSVNMSVVRYNIYRGTTPENMEKVASQVNVPYNYHYEYRDEFAPCGDYYYMVGANYGEEECFTEALLVSITSVSDNAARLGIYPNPTQGHITVSTEGAGELRIVNSLGQTLIQTELGQDDLQLDLTPFGKGIYMVIVRSEQGVATKKIIVE
nr:T9SS type A sorting domain-containing protein [Bacteroidales bacterium]